jgi:ATP-dependent RNA helicase RhlE
MERSTFNDLGLIEPILKALQTEGYTHPTPIQEQAIPHLVKGRDLLGCAQTGTGKTAAFAIPILQTLHAKGPQGARRKIKTLILTPTRELAIQIGESFSAYGRNLQLKHTVIFGGVGQKPQTDALQSGVDIVVATPGRLLDLMQQGFVHLNDLEIFVLDEADRMLDMGFIHDVKKVIAKLPQKRQTLFFSATMPPEIAKLANSILTEPVKVEVAPVSSTAETIDQRIFFVDRTDKNKLLLHLLQGDTIREALVFSRTKHGANKIAKVLTQAGFAAEAIHGNKSQTARQNALKGFKEGKLRALVATDIAARGIDIDGLTHVINFDLPNVPETYVHRIGRTGRAGASGRALSFCDHEEKEYLRDITRLIKRDIPVEAEHPYVMVGGPKKAEPEVREPRQPRGPGRGQGQRHGGRPQGDRSAQGGGRDGSARNDRGPREQRPAHAQGPRRDERGGREQRPAHTNAQRHDRRDDRAPREQRPAQGQRNDRRNDRPRQEQRRDQPRPERDQRPREPQRERAPQADRTGSAAKPDYAALTKELFGEDAERSRSDQQEKKKKGFGLGRLFGR